MKVTENPYAPGAGAPPPALAGRDSLLKDIAVNLERIRGGRHANSVLVTGLRGVGKTVLLNHVARDAEKRNIVCLDVEVSEQYSLFSLLAPVLRKALTKLDRVERAKNYAWQALAGFLKSVRLEYQDVTVRLDVDHKPGVADSGNLEMDLSDLLIAVGELAREKETAVSFFIDELQYAKEDQLAPLIAALHGCQQKQLPVVIVGAGLPQLVGKVGKAKSYTERLFDFSEVGKLEEEDARAALELPAAREGVSFKVPALAAILSQTQCYPYFLQEWGSQSWFVATKKTITLSDVQTASNHAREKLDTGFFRVRYNRCTPIERKYLRAMAELGPGPHKSGEIAALMKREVQSVAPQRSSLISKGMLYSPKHGDTAFTVPLFDEFMKRTMPSALSIGS